MDTNLRPLTLGEILDRTAQLYRTNFLLFAGIFAMTNGIVLVLILLFEGVSPAYRSVQTGGKFQPEAFVFAGMFLVLGFLAYGASTAAITRAVAWVNVGQPASVRAAYSSTLPRLGRYLWLMTLALLLILGIALLGLLALAIVMAIAGALFAFVFAGSPAAARIVGLVVGALFDLGAFAVIAWVAGRYALGIPACVVEDLKARKALRRSVELSKGSRGRMFLLFLLVLVVQMGLVLVTQIPFYIYSFRHHFHLPLGLSILSQIISVGTNTLVGPILATGLTLFYFDQRVRKEGYDIEWMMQAAGMVPEPSPAEAQVPAEPDSVTEPAIAPPHVEITPAAETLGNVHE
jgi:hypothetical protein